MCGIAGIVLNKDSEIKEEEISEMLNLLKHRGPNDDGYFRFNNLLLGQTRLSIIDTTSAGHQPMQYSHKNKTVVITYNGEVYNYKSLKKILIKKGYTFTSGTDTEVVAACYLEYGDSCVERFEGMFAFVIFDKQKKILFGARDRFGQKPFYYHKSKNSFLFGSEPKAILSQLKTKSIDYQAIYHYLTLGYIPAPFSGFKEIKKLPQATWFTYCLETKKFKTKKYFSLNFISKKEQSKKEWKKEISKSFTMAVQKRLVADVPLGSFLSGGIDSSAITAIAAQAKKQLQTFCISFTSKKEDESLYAKIMADHAKTQHMAYCVNQDDFQQNFISLIQHADVPFADPSYIPTYLLSEFTKKEVTVALSGDAGDENFAGYDKYRAFHILNTFPLLTKIVSPILNNKKGKLGKIFKLKDKDVSEKYYELTHFFDSAQKDIILDNKKYNKEWGSEYKEVLSKKVSKIKDTTDALMALDFEVYIPDNINVKVDMASMKSGLEVRVPMLDHSFVQLCASMPSLYKLNIFKGKLIFKQLLKDFLPQEILKRKKHGFIVPLDKWVGGDIDHEALKKLGIHIETDITDKQRYLLKVLVCWYKKQF